MSIKEGFIIWLGKGKPDIKEEMELIYSKPGLSILGTQLAQAKYNIYLIHIDGITSNNSLDFWRSLVGGHICLPITGTEPCLWDLIANDEALFNSELSYINPLTTKFPFLSGQYTGPLAITGLNRKMYDLDSLSKENALTLLKLGGLIE